MIMGVSSFSIRQSFFHSRFSERHSKLRPSLSTCRFESSLRASSSQEHPGQGLYRKFAEYAWEKLEESGQWDISELPSDLKFQEAEAKGLGVVSLGSKMIDRPVVLRARKLVDRAREAGLIGEEGSDV